MKNLYLLALITSLNSCAYFNPQPLQDTPKSKVVESQPINITTIQVTPLTNHAEANTINSSPKVEIVKHFKHSVKSSRGFLASNTFDISYSGNILGLPRVLKEYDPSLIILKPLGKVNKVNVGINVNSIDINTLQDIVKSNTKGRVILEYLKAKNSLRLIYSSKVVTVASSALTQSKKWQQGDTPLPILSKDGLVLYPYGEYEPQVTCQPLNLCDIQLEARELVKSVLIGDSSRWNSGDGSVPIVYSGSANAQIPHIVLKPVYAGLTTTLFITTNKRTYYIKLLSSNTDNLSRVGFYYPNEQMIQYNTTQKLARTNSIELSDGGIPKIDPSKMNFNYKVTGNTSAHFKPTQVFDDSNSVYIQMPADIKQTDLPAFYVIGRDGSTLELVNFQYKSPFYIVHKLFDKGALILGVGNYKQKIIITRTNPHKYFWQR